MWIVAERGCIIFEVSAFLSINIINERKFSKKNEAVARLTVDKSVTLVLNSK